MEHKDDVLADRGEIIVEPNHKIFLSHSGAQKDFVEQLCLDLEACDRNPFFDIRWDSLPIGVHFPTKFFNAIQQCQVGVLILSEEFFTRTKWPMLELVALVNSKKHNSNLVIIPVFLGISREECRQKENHDRWLSTWQEWARTSNLNHKIDTQEWIEALQLFGSTNSIAYDKALGKVKCRKEIVDAICRHVPPETRWDDSRVEGKTRICKVINQHFERTQISYIYKTRTVGLYGIGGIGKTTACKILCNYLREDFRDKVCYVDMGNKFLEVLHTMLKKLTNIKHEFLTYDIGECIARLKKVIHKDRIFLAIDNVSESSDTTVIIDHTKTLLNLKKYAEDSIVLVVARSLDLLQNLNIAESDCLEMPELNKDEAKSLFLQRIFISSNEKHDELIKNCIERCYFRKDDRNNYHYHPLALEVLSIQLSTLNPYEWMEQLMTVDTFNQFCDRKHPIFSILRTGYDNLKSQDDQDLFMDIVLFSPEDDKYETRTNVFEWLSMVHGKSINTIITKVKNFKKKSLIECMDDGIKKISVHDLWHEFCIIETTRGEMECRSWLYEDYGYQFKSEESELFKYGNWKKLSRICLRSNNYDDVNMREIDFSQCSNLIVLKLIGLDLTNTFLDLSNLKYLKSLEICQAKTPISVTGLGFLKHLVVLRLDPLPVEAQFISEIGYLTKLQVLYLKSKEEKDNSLNIQRLILLREVSIYEFWRGIDTFSLGLSSKMKHIQSVNLVSCSFLQNIQGLNDLVTLKHLCIKSCPNLQDIDNLYQLKMLQHLSISGCDMIETLYGIGDLIALEKLQISYCKNLARISNLGKLQRLQILYMEGCKSITSLHGLGDLLILKDLRLNGCENLVEVPDLKNLEKLEIFHMDHCKSVKLLLDLEHLRNLEIFTTNGCENLMVVPNIQKLHKLRLLDLEGCKAITKLPNLGNLVSLEDLRLNACASLEEVPDLQKLKRLQVLYMHDCKSIIALPDLSNLMALEYLNIDGCENLLLFPSLKNLERLQILYMEDCKLVTSLLGLDNLISLEHLKLNGCGSLVEVSNLENLQNLEILYMEGCTSITTLAGIGELVALEDLRLTACKNLREIPNLQKLGRLKILYMEDCKSITTLIGLDNLTMLEDLRLNGCENLVELPNLQKLHMLQFLYMEDCTSVTVLPDLGHLRNLKHLKMGRCTNLIEVYNLQKLSLLQVLSMKGCISVRRLHGLEELLSLEELILKSCESLTTVPDLSKLKRLRLLYMDYCCLVTELPGLNSLTALNDLRLNHCVNLEEVFYLQGLKNLRILHMEGCKSIRILSGLKDLVALEELKVDACENLVDIPHIQKLNTLELVSTDGCRSMTKLSDLGKQLAEG
ncbi:hypothetical protein M758_11G148700 [Ceratodon purpureus]|nr:hypothetical protein M758_11G148700 [Ceratodon purpureus]